MDGSANAPVATRSAVLGDEHDAALRARLMAVLRQLGAGVVGGPEIGLAGSQEIETLDEVTMRVNGARSRADMVARDPSGRLHVFEIKHGSGALTRNQRASGVYDMTKPSNTAQHLGGGVVKPGLILPPHNRTRSMRWLTRSWSGRRAVDVA